MEKPSWCEARSSIALGACCLLGIACTAELEGGEMPPGTMAAAGTPGAGAGVSNPGGAGASTSVPGNGSAQGGSVGVGSGGVPGASAGDGFRIVENPPAFAPSPGMLRRLTRTQFHHALRDLLGEQVDVNQLAQDRFDGRFITVGFATTGASVVVTSDQGVEQYHAAIETAVGAVFADATRRASLMGCTPSAAGDACTKGFLQSLGRRAWRRPLESAELERLVAVAQTAGTELGSPIDGARWATVALFESPSFLYRPELGAPGALRFSGYEMAARLAFLIWNSVPDNALLDEAESGALRTADGIRAAATRMLAAPAGRDAAGTFAEEYLRLDKVVAQPKDPALFPTYVPALQTAMVRDMRDTWEAVLFDDQGSMLSLFTTNKAVVNAELAALYGVNAGGPSPGAFQTVSLPDTDPRVGILGKAAFLSQWANQHEGSPTLRGRFLREAFLCSPVPPPPMNVNTDLSDPEGSAPRTHRQRLEEHSTNPGCAGCHALMDPMGFPFENFDAIGAYRTTDNGFPVDPSGSFPKSDGTSVPVNNAREYQAAAAASELVAKCFVRQFYAYAMGYMERDLDGSVLNELSQSFAASGFKFQDLVVNLVAHDAFSAVAPQP